MVSLAVALILSAASSALQTHANENALASGIVRMLDAARSIAPQPHFEMLGYEIIGKLRGMDRSVS